MKMRVFFLTNNEITNPLSSWLENEADEEVLGFSERITISELKAFNPDYIISYSYRYIIDEEVIKVLAGRILNLHISLLPWNRGADPNLWSFLDETSKGVSIHYIDSGIDTGDVLLQKELIFDESKETLESSYKTLHNEICKLFISNWDAIKEGKITAKAQQGEGSFHRSNESSKIKEAFGRRLWSEPIFLLKRKLKEMSLI